MSETSWRYRTNWRRKLVLQIRIVGWHPYYGSGYAWWRDATVEDLTLATTLPPTRQEKEA